MGEGDIKLLTADDLSKMVRDESVNSLVGRMVFIECRPKEGRKWLIFPAFVQEERPKSKHRWRHWVVAIVQRLEGSIEMVKVRIREEDIGVRYRIWEDVPYMLDLAKAGEWPEIGQQAIDVLKKAEETTKSAVEAAGEACNGAFMGEPANGLPETATDGDKEEEDHGSALQPGEDRSGEGVPGKELDTESHADE